VTPRTLEPKRTGSEQREVTHMTTTKKLLAATLAALALAAVPATSVALSDNSEGVHLGCNGSGGSGGCYG
jgi:hypothetical protein